MASSSSRPWRLRMRSDVECQRQSFQGRDCWLVKDPVALKYYRFEEEEFALLQMLDGVRSPDQVKLQFDYDFAPQKITLPELSQFVGSLYRSNLLISDGPGQGVLLYERGSSNRRKEWQAKLQNVLAIRFRGFDPDSFLTGLERWFGWLFSWPCVAATLALMLVAIGLVVSNFESFQDKLPSMQEFFASGNWIWLALVLGWTKVLHELGHGLACKRFGSQCHEMGLMFLVLTPCLYCNVSDSWTLPSKWRRAAIAAAGMYVEWMLASLAVFVWWFSEPGLVNQLALNVVVVCSISTLLFNANPLLRYDGYYILSDLVEIPNLRQKATSMLQRTAANWLAGLPTPPDPFMPAKRKIFFQVYAIAAVVYRWLITIAIFWFLYRLLEPYGLKLLGQLIAVTAIYGLIGAPLLQLRKFLATPGRMRTMKTSRLVAAGSIGVAILLGVLAIPIPRYVVCPFVVQPAEVTNLYVEVPGELVSIMAKPNQPVAAEQPIVMLQSRELEADLGRMADDAQRAQIRLVTHQKAAQVAAAEAQQAASQLPALEASYAAAVSRFDTRRLDYPKLTVCSPIAGVLLPPLPKSPEENVSELETWTGTPLDEENLGAWLAQKTLVGRVFPTGGQVEAQLVVPEAEIEFIRQGLAVELCLEQDSSRRLAAATETVAPTEMTSIPRQLASLHGGSVQTSQGRSGDLVPVDTHFLVKVSLAESNNPPFLGATGQAKIIVGSQTVGYRLWRLAIQTFRFEL